MQDLKLFYKRAKVEKDLLQRRKSSTRSWKANQVPLKCNYYSLYFERQEHKPANQMTKKLMVVQKGS